MPGNGNENVGIAFALVIGAGLSTAIGASVVFFPSLVQYASRRTLAGALGLSAGVMCYVSFVEILQKSMDSFEEAGHDENDAYVYATLCFFGGVFFMVALNYMVTSLLGGHGHHHHDDPIGRDTNSVTREPSDSQQKANAPVAVCACHSENPGADLDNLQHMAEKMQAKCCDDSDCDAEDFGAEGNQASCKDSDAEGNQASENISSESGSSDEERVAKEAREAEDAKKLMRMSINTAIAIGLHNFPEGLATFVAALNDPGVGAVLAVAIAIHNIPEGLCVAMPIYYATGDRWKAFGWALFSGLAEPIAALLGWAVLANSFSEDMYGVLFGLVAGMMVIISVRELLPTAHRYDPEDTVVTYSFMAGMVIMAVSLALFVI